MSSPVAAGSAAVVAFVVVPSLDVLVWPSFLWLPFLCPRVATSV